MKKLCTTAVAALLAAMMLLLCVTAVAAEKPEYDSDFDKLSHIIELYLDIGLADKPRDELLMDMLERLMESYPGLLETLAGALLTSNDPYGAYYTQDAWTGVVSAKNYYGIGVALEIKSDGAVVLTSISPGGPADRAGIKPGDQLVHVDGTGVLNKSINTVRDMLRGEDESPVSLGVMRGGEVMLFELVRERLTMRTVTAQWYEDYVYMKISDFMGLLTYFEFLELIIEISESYTGNIIIDLRGNGGGEVDVALNMANRLVRDEGEKLLTQKGKPSGGESETIYSTGDGYVFDNIVILVNGSTASAAEMFAIILQDLDIATVIGVQTYGKGVAQVVTPLLDGSFVSITAYEYLSPSGKRFDGEGVTPDIVVKNSYEKRELPQMGLFSHANYAQAAAGGQNEVVLALEQRLCLLGAMTVADDVFDEDTAEALRYYQRTAGLKETGELDLLTFQSITDTVNLIKQIDVEVDRQLEAAVELLVASR